MEEDDLFTGTIRDAADGYLRLAAFMYAARKLLIGMRLVGQRAALMELTAAC